METIESEPIDFFLLEDTAWSINDYPYRDDGDGNAEECNKSFNNICSDESNGTTPPTNITENVVGKYLIFNKKPPTTSDDNLIKCK